MIKHFNLRRKGNSMRCIACGFETNSNAAMAIHFSECKGKPLETWRGFSEYNMNPKPCKSSEVFGIILEEESEE
uniref:Uncharacterized protein n=1 Tax=viral metagenome TaxID=1070528 RepID=A0A6M3JMH4_9ZZZZ